MRSGLSIALVLLVAAAIGMQGWMIWREIAAGSRSRAVIFVRALNIVLLLGLAGLIVFALARW